MGITRQYIFGIDPKGGVCQTFGYAQVPDANTSGKAITCAHYPAAKGSGVSLMQETLFFGTTSAVGKMFQTFKDSQSLDGTEAIEGEFITARLDPDNRADGGPNRGRDSTQKRFYFVNHNSPTMIDRGGTLYWTKDVDPLTDSMVVWTEFQANEGDTKFYFEKGNANWIHLRGVHDGVSSNSVHLSGFALNYDTISRGEGRDS